VENFYISVENLKTFQAVEAYTCNISYSGGRDQDHGLKPAWANSWLDLILKIPSIKKGWWSGSMYKP
jgi:hypothetical protein